MNGLLASLWWPLRQTGASPQGSCGRTLSRPPFAVIAADARPVIARMYAKSDSFSLCQGQRDQAKDTRLYSRCYMYWIYPSNDVIRFRRLARVSNNQNYWYAL